MIQKGIISKSSQLPPLHPRVKNWDSLTVMEKKIEARKMELYAGMVDNLDYHVGKLIAYLKETGEYENTIILFMSDNGAAANDFYYHPNLGPFIREHFTDEYEKI